MKNTMKAGALLLAGMLALSACGSSDEPASASDSEAASASPSPTATLAVGQEQYTADELLAAVEAVNAAQGGTGEVSDDAALRQYLTDQSLPEGITVTPAECEGIAGFANFFGEVDQANLASVKLGADQKLTVVSHSEASALDAQMQDNDGLLGECAEFEMGDEEFTAAGTTERLDVSTGAPQTQAFSLTMTAAGTALSGLKVSAATGTTNIVLTNSNATDPEEASAQAAELIDAVLAELEK